ncbi:MAG: HD domain-containing protein, partial [Clostridium sp.]
DNSYSNIKSGDVVEVSGSVKEFKGMIQVHITEVKALAEVDQSILDKLTPCCSVSEAKIREEISLIIDSIEDVYIQKLINKVFDIQEVKEGFYTKSAGAEIHHAYVRGLAQHSLEVVQNTISYCEMKYPIKRDVAVAIALMHDIGKVYELSDFPENKYTDVGKLIGHISIGSSLIERCISEIEGFPADVAIDIVHGILSHHGNKEMGSPVLPMTLEAIAVHNADKASAEINAFYLAIQRDNTDSNWTEYNNIYKRCVKKS